MTLRVYDWVVLGISNRWIWRCPTAELLNLYDRNLSDRHLDVGVGTGFFLDRANWPVPRPDVTLLDLNPHSLNVASRRIARFSPTTIQANILEPLPITGAYRSAGLCYLLHCLPGAITEKAIAFDHIAAVLAPGATVFGATIVQDSPSMSRTAQALMSLYNRRGVFSNTSDTLEDLGIALEQRFDAVTIHRNGCVAVFEARTRAAPNPVAD